MLKITPPQIDERSFKQMLEQIRAKVPFYTPEWNPNQEGETGLALTRIYLHMLEQVLARLNQVPQKNFVAFLDMLGIDLKPAQSARAIVTFALAEGTSQHVLVPQETQMAAEGAIDGQEVIFETERDVRVTPATLVEIFSFDAPGDRIYRHTAQHLAGASFQLFTGQNLQERSLYIGHSDLLSLTNPTDIIVDFALQRATNSDDLIIVWEFWNGERWVALQTFRKQVSDGQAVFDPNDKTKLFSKSDEMILRKTTLDEIVPYELFDQGENRWLRCRLQNQLSSRQPLQLPVIDTLRISTSPVDPFPAELAFNNDVPLNLDQITLEMQAIPGFQLGFPDKRDLELEFAGKDPANPRIVLLNLTGGEDLSDTDYLIFDNRSEAAEIRQVTDVTTAGDPVQPIQVTLDSSLAHEYDNDSKVSVIDQPPKKKDNIIFVTASFPTGDSFQVNDFLKLDSTFEAAEIRTISGPTEVFTVPSGSYMKIEIDQRLQYDYDNPQAVIEFATALRATGTKVKVETFSGLEVREGSKATLVHGNVFETVILEETMPESDTELTLPVRTGNTYVAGDLINIIPLIKPFGELPAIFDIFYLASDEAFSKKGAEVTLDIDAVWNGADYSGGNPSPPVEVDAVLSWEYWNGKSWRGIRVTDETDRFFMGHKAKFILPDDIEKIEINGEEKYWIRVRITDGDFGKELIVEPQNGPFPLLRQGTVHFPIIRSLLIDYVSVERVPERCFTLNNLDFNDRLDEVIDPDRSFAPFSIVTENFASLFLGFDKKLEGGPISILFDLTEQFLSEDDRVKMRWFYWNGSNWIQLNVNDRTEHLTKKDLLRFSVPNDFAQRELFDKNLFWIKGSIVESTHPEPVEILHIFPNSTDAVQASFADDEVLGSSDSTADQEFQLLNPLVISTEVRVIEPNRPSEEEISALIADEAQDDVAELIKEIKDTVGETTGYEVRWHVVDDFDESGPQSRHYMVDRRLGIIRFGDGVNGLVPPVGTDNIIADYKFGGGKNGNVLAGRISALKNAIPFVSEVTNHLAADGGSETETLDEVLVRGPLRLKNRDRAVAAEDFESLARNASRKIVRAKCLPNTDEAGEHAPGKVTVLIVPDSQVADEPPTRLLIKTVEDYLLQQTANVISAPEKIHVTGANYVEVIVEPVLVPVDIDRAARVESEALARLHRFIHPITGGADRCGWDFGKKICRSEILALLEGVPFVDFVSDLKIKANGIEYRGDVELDRFSLPFSGEHRINITFGGTSVQLLKQVEESDCAEESFFEKC